MKRAAEEVKALPTYLEVGEVILYYNIYTNFFLVVMTDARHDFISNAYNTAMTCLSGRYNVHGQSILYLVIL